ncbi:MAG: hypothetical protein WBC44_06040 [Planctomycetaceae bacterium]
MVRIIVDSAVEPRFTDARHVTEVCDAAGRVLGHFVPTLQHDVLDPGISDEEIERRIRKGGGRPLADILADLEKLA